MNVVARFLVGAFLLATACAPAAPQPAGSVPQAQVREEKQALKVAVKAVVGNPTPSASNGDHHMFWNMYDKLTEFVGDYEVKPSVAESWSLSADQKTWTFTIRRDMKFSNGDPLTAEDVAFSLNTVRENRWPQISYFGTMTGARATSPTVVEVSTSRPDVTVPYAATFLWVIPKKYYESVGQQGFQQKPVGSGPYELVSFRANDSLVFKRRAEPHPFRRPAADDLTFQAIPDNAGIIAGLQTGDIDIATDISFSGDQATRLKSQGVTVSTRTAAVIYLNIPQGSYELRDTPLKDTRVRLALKYAVNREAIASKIFGGFTRVANEMAIPGTLYSLPNAPSTPYDPARAKALLAEAGYPNGFTLAAGMDWTTSFTIQDVAVAVQADLKAIGIEVAPQLQELTVYVDKAFGRNNATLGDLTIGRLPDVIGFGPSRTFIGCGKPVGGTPAVLTWCSAEWDTLLDTAFGEPDAAKRRELLQRANQLQLASNSMAPLYFEPSFVAARPVIRGLDYQHVAFYKFDNAYKVKG